MEKLIIVRSKWLRGQGSSNSCLLNEEGKMCCLGFYAKQHGYEDDEIFLKKTPGDLPFRDTAMSKLSISQGKNTVICNELIRTNDFELYLEFEREKELTKIFNKIDVEVEFTDYE